jgi:hypothetical protein
MENEADEKHVAIAGGASDPAAKRVRQLFHISVPEVFVSAPSNTAPIVATGLEVSSGGSWLKFCYGIADSLRTKRSREAVKAWLKKSTSNPGISCKAVAL